jgi:hypothetical protein
MIHRRQEACLDVDGGLTPHCPSLRHGKAGGHDQWHRSSAFARPLKRHLAIVDAHRIAMPLDHELTSPAGVTWKTTTAPDDELLCPMTLQPRKPGLLRIGSLRRKLWTLRRISVAALNQAQGRSSDR